MGPALGLAVGPWPVTTISLRDGTGVLLYSDGLVESRERDLFSGIDAMQQAVEALEARRRNARELCARLADVLVPADAGDDVTVLAVTPADPRASAVRTFPGDRASAGQARRFVAGVLSDWSLSEEVVERATLCVSELVTNAIIHAGSETTVTVRSDVSHLLLLVHDNGSHNRVRLDEAGPDEISGRGLSLVEALCTAWNVEQSTDGTVVWCELELTPADAGSEAAALEHGDVAS